MKILYDEIMASLNNAKEVIYVTVPYRDEGGDIGDIREVDLIYDYSESPDGVYADTEYASGEQTYRLDGVQFVASSGYAPQLIEEMAEHGKFNQYAEKAWGG